MILRFLTIIFFYSSVINMTLGQQGDDIDQKNTYRQRINGDSILQHIKVLASDDFEGREMGSSGYDRAVNYVIEELTHIGIQQHPKLNAYIQEFGVYTLEWKRFRFKLGSTILKPRFDIIPFQSKVNDFTVFKSKKISFLGYGSKEDLEKAQKEKTGLLLIDETHPLSQQEIDEIRYETKRKGIELLLIVHNDFENIKKTYRSKMTSFKKIELDPNQSSVLYLSERYAKLLLETIESDLRTYRNGGRLSTLPTINYAVSLSSKKSSNGYLTSKNVVGFIEGSDPDLKNEIVVVSAHLDHIGKRSETMIFNGADDNGSGSSTLIELAKNTMLSKMKGKGFKRSVLFVWFAGEEKGLLGSKYFVNNAFLDLDAIKIDLNVDMIGRRDKEHDSTENYIYIIGVDKINPDLKPILEDVNTSCCNLSLDYTFNDENDPNRFYYRSDHYNFAKNGIPVIFFFSGVHDDYHKETDTYDKIDLSKLQSRAQLIYHVLYEVANRTNFTY